MMSWSDLPSGGSVSNFCRVDLLLVNSRSKILSPRVGLSMTCSMLCSREMSMRRWEIARFPPASGEITNEGQWTCRALKSPPSQMLPLVLCVS